MTWSAVALGAFLALLSSGSGSHAATCTSIHVTPSAVSEEGVTFEFDGSYECGQFITGDWWVLDPAPADESAGVVIAKMMPASTPTRNGWNWNPCVIGAGAMNGEVCQQPYDDRIGEFSKVGSLALGAEPGIPEGGYVANHGESIVKCNSYVDPHPGDDSCEEDLDPNPNSKHINKGCCVSIAVLTVLDQAPPTDAFRPPYVGDEKPIYRAGEVDLERLPDLPWVAIDEPTFAQVEGFFPGPWIDHRNGHDSRQMHPKRNMLAETEPADYGAALSRVITKSILMTMMDWPNESKRRTINSVVQYGTPSLARLFACTESSEARSSSLVGAGLDEGERSTRASSALPRASCPRSEG